MIRKISIFLFFSLMLLIILNIKKDAPEKIESPLMEEKITIKKEIIAPKKEMGPKLIKVQKKTISVKKIKDKKIRKKSPHQRVIFNSGKLLSEEEKDRLDFINEENPDWKEELSRKLLDTLDENPTLKVIKEKSLIKILGKKAQYIEQAIVIIEYENGKENSFRALIDSETGKIIRSWDRTIHENFGKRPTGLTPSGSL